MKKFFIPLFAALLSCSAFAADAPVLAGMADEAQHGSSNAVLDLSRQHH